MSLSDCHLSKNRNCPEPPISGVGIVKLLYDIDRSFKQSDEYLSKRVLIEGKDTSSVYRFGVARSVKRGGGDEAARVFCGPRPGRPLSGLKLRPDRWMTGFGGAVFIRESRNRDILLRGKARVLPTP